jgi:hypothetical protein
VYGREVLGTARGRRDGGATGAWGYARVAFGVHDFGHCAEDIGGGGSRKAAGLCCVR